MYLGIDSSTMVGSVALLADDTMVGEYTLNLRRTHSERLMVAIEHLLCMSGVKPDALDAICVAVGPGSYTGVRIGVTTSKTLAWTLGKPLVAVNTLDALARIVPAGLVDAVIAPSVAAKGTLVFGAAYDALGDYPVLMPPEPLDVVEYISRLAKYGRTIIPVGDGYCQHSRLFRAADSAARFFSLPAHSALPRASLVVEVARHRLARGEVSDPRTLAPTYLRIPEAEAVWASKHGTQS